MLLEIIYIRSRGWKRLEPSNRLKRIMKKNVQIFVFLCITLLTYQPSIFCARSIHRPKDLQMPSITTHWADDETGVNYLQSPYLEGYPFFEIYDQNYFDRHLLPAGPITFRNRPDKSVDSRILATMIEKLVEEVHNKKTSYTHFSILRDSNFNRRKKSGLLIVKCKTYPFVVKLFMETPDMFVHPHRKGFYPALFYFMGGGVNRHLSGFTRIKNAEAFKEAISKNIYWASRVDVPRKWYWTPKNSRMITITGTNIGKYKHTSINIPSTYCIVSDLIDIERRMTLVKKEDRIESLALCNMVKFSVDPHIDNFMIERDTKKIVLIDTEHMPTMVGFKKEVGSYTSQTAWYIDLSLKCIDDMFFRDKSRWHES